MTNTITGAKRSIQEHREGKQAIVEAMENAEPENRIVISKRKADDEGENQEKRLRVETQAALAIVEKQGIARSSTLLAPTMLLTGHQAAVYTLKFDPTGLALASAGADRGIFLWDTRGECNNYNVLRGHKNVSLCDRLRMSGSSVRPPGTTQEPTRQPFRNRI